MSNFGVSHLKYLLHWKDLKIAPIANEIEFHPAYIQSEIVDFCQERGIAIYGYGTLANESLRGRKGLQTIAKELGLSVPQVKNLVLAPPKFFFFFRKIPFVNSSFLKVDFCICIQWITGLFPGFDCTVKKPFDKFFFVSQKVWF